MNVRAAAYTAIRHVGTPSGLERAGFLEWIRTFAIITTAANEAVADIHDRMPVILEPANYVRWLRPNLTRAN